MYNTQKLKKVKVTKVSEENGAHYRGYSIQGYLLSEPISIGQQLVVFRYNRNGVDAAGLFQTSFVKEIIHEENNKLSLQTENSVWMLEYI